MFWSFPSFLLKHDFREKGRNCRASLTVIRPECFRTSICLSVRSCVHQSVCLSIDLYMRSCVNQSVCLPVSAFKCLSVRLCACLPISAFLCQSVCLYVCAFLCPSVCQCVYVSVCLSDRMFDRASLNLCDDQLSACLSVRLCVDQSVSY